MKNKLISLLAVPLISGLIGCATPTIQDKYIQKSPMNYQGKKIMSVQSDYRQFCDCYEMEKTLRTANKYLKELEVAEKKERKEYTGDLVSAFNLGITLKLEEELIQSMEKILETEENCGCFGITL